MVIFLLVFVLFWFYRPVWSLDLEGPAGGSSASADVAGAMGYRIDSHPTRAGAPMAASQRRRLRFLRKSGGEPVSPPGFGMADMRAIRSTTGMKAWPFLAVGDESAFSEAGTPKSSVSNP
jgi:hypothetical protein